MRRKCTVRVRRRPRCREQTACEEEDKGVHRTGEEEDKGVHRAGEQEEGSSSSSPHTLRGNSALIQTSGLNDLLSADCCREVRANNQNKGA